MKKNEYTVQRLIKATAVLVTSSGTNTSKSVTDHSLVTTAPLTYISVPALIEDQTCLAGSVPGSQW